MYGMPSRKRVFMVTRRGGLPPDHTKSPARRERARKAGENGVSADAVIGRASGGASGIERERDAVRCCKCREITYICNISCKGNGPEVFRRAVCLVPCARKRRATPRNPY